MTSVLRAMEEYKVKPYSLGNFLGKQFTITEDQPVATDLRTTKLKSEKDGSMYEVYLLRISDGIFEKDLAITKNNLPKVMRCLPKGITNLKGITIAEDRGNFVFITQETDIEKRRENYPSSQPEQKAEMPKQLNDYAAMLGNAVKSNNTYGIPTNIQVLTKMADTIYPNRALDVIQAAKAAGLIYEQNNEYKAV